MSRPIFGRKSMLRDVKDKRLVVLRRMMGPKATHVPCYLPTKGLIAWQFVGCVIPPR